MKLAWNGYLTYYATQSNNLCIGGASEYNYSPTLMEGGGESLEREIFYSLSTHIDNG